MRPGCFFAAFIGGTIVLIAGLIAFVPFLINTPFVKEGLVGFVQERTGVSIPTQGIFLDISMVDGRPCLGTRLHDMEIPLSSAGKAHIGSFQTQWDLGELFKGKAACRAIQVDDVRINLFAVEKSSSPDLSFLQDPTPVFSYFSHHQKKVEIIFDHVSCPFFSYASGVCSIYRENAFVTCTSKIKDILIKKNQPLVKDLVPQALPIETLRAGSCDLELKAHLSGSKVSMKTVLKKVALDSSRLEHPLTSASGGTLVFSKKPGKFDLRLGPVQWDFPQSCLGYSWSYDKQKKPRWNMVFSGQKIHVDQAASVCLALGGENDVVHNLFTILPGGQADQAEVAFSSNTLEDLFDPDTMTISGRVDNARVQIPTTSLELTQVQGEASMEKGKLMVQASSGMLGNTWMGASDFEIDLVHFKDFPFHGKFDLDADMAQLPQVLATLLPHTALAREMKQISCASGRAQGVLFLDAPPDNSLDIQVNIHNITGTVDYLPFGRPLHIHKGSLVYTPEKIYFDNIFADMGQNVMQGISGQAALSPPHSMKLSSGSAFLNAREVVSLLQRFSFLPSNVVTRIEGNVILERICLKGPFLDPGQWKYEVSGQAKDLGWEFSPDLPWAFELPWLETLSGQFLLTQDQVHWQGETGYQVRGRVKNTENGIQVHLDQVDLCQFVGKGEFLFSPAPGKPGIDLSMNIQSMDNSSVSSLFACLLKDGSMVEGPCSFSCDLRHKGPVKDLLKNLQGEMTFSSFEGKIHRATLLARILSVINIFHIQDVIQKGFDYHFIKIKAAIENGRIQLTHAVIDAKSMVLLFSGWIDPFADKLDLTCLVAPLKTVDNIIEHIPLVNVIVGKKLLSIPVGIQGNLQDPDIMILNPSDMGNHLLRLFEHVITAPARLFDMNKKESGAPE